MSMAAAAQPVPEGVEAVRQQVRETLRRIRAKAKRGKLNQDSTLFRVQQKMTANGLVTRNGTAKTDAELRRTFLEEEEEPESDVEAVADQG